MPKIDPQFATVKQAVRRASISSSIPHRGLTFKEVLATIVILSIFTIAIFPVLQKNKMDKNVHEAKNNLKGFLRGLQVYQAQNNQEVDYGTPEQMGLPPHGQGYASFVHEYTGIYSPMWDSMQEYLPCGQLKNQNEQETGIGYMAQSLDDWPHWLPTYRENSIVLYDANCNPPGTDIQFITTQVHVIGISLNSEIRECYPQDHHGFNSQLSWTKGCMRKDTPTPAHFSDVNR